MLFWLVFICNEPANSNYSIGRNNEKSETILRRISVSGVSCLRCYCGRDKHAQHHSSTAFPRSVLAYNNYTNH